MTERATAGASAPATTSSAGPSTPPVGPGGNALGVVGIVVVAALMMALAGVLIVGLIALWPTAAGGPTLLPGIAVGPDPERALLLVVALSGALGGTVHALRSLYWYVGNRALHRSWLLMYAFIPLVGSALALIVYVVFRGGLLSGQAAPTDLNPYGFSAVAAMVGLFSAQATAKLQEVFSVLFSPAEKGRDRVPSG